MNKEPLVDPSQIQESVTIQTTKTITEVVYVLKDDPGRLYISAPTVSILKSWNGKVISENTGMEVQPGHKWKAYPSEPGTFPSQPKDQKDTNYHSTDSTITMPVVNKDALTNDILNTIQSKTSDMTTDSDKKHKKLKRQKSNKFETEGEAKLSRTAYDTRSDKSRRKMYNITNTTVPRDTYDTPNTAAAKKLQDRKLYDTVSSNAYKRNYDAQPTTRTTFYAPGLSPSRNVTDEVSYRKKPYKIRSIPQKLRERSASRMTPYEINPHIPESKYDIRTKEICQYITDDDPDTIHQKNEINNTYQTKENTIPGARSNMFSGWKKITDYRSDKYRRVREEATPTMPSKIENFNRFILYKNALI